MEQLCTASRRGMEKVIHDVYSDLFDSHIHLPPHHLREDGHAFLKVLSSEFRHVIMSVKNRTSSIPDRIKPEHLKYLPPVLINTLARLFTPIPVAMQVTAFCAYSTYYGDPITLKRVYQKSSTQTNARISTDFYAQVTYNNQSRTFRLTIRLPSSSFSSKLAAISFGLDEQASGAGAPIRRRGTRLLLFLEFRGSHTQNTQ
ncbi:hypothetical protein RB195_007434 [Necator americanus]|uniref:Uncharacterized protein n=1 Tax=Necator americanus TaxID=51031 RepID=A0ABR1BX93_NECAM